MVLYIYDVYMNYTHTHTHTYTYTYTHSLFYTYYIIFIYCLRFHPSCVVCHVLLDLGKLIRKKQQTAALIVFNVQKMRFPMKQVHACMEKRIAKFEYLLLPN